MSLWHCAERAGGVLLCVRSCGDEWEDISWIVTCRLTLKRKWNKEQTVELTSIIEALCLLLVMNWLDCGTWTKTTWRPASQTAGQWLRKQGRSSHLYIFHLPYLYIGIYDIRNNIFIFFTSDVLFQGVHAITGRILRRGHWAGRPCKHGGGWVQVSLHVWKSSLPRYWLHSQDSQSLRDAGLSGTRTMAGALWGCCPGEVRTSFSQLTRSSRAWQTT